MVRILKVTAAAIALSAGTAYAAASGAAVAAVASACCAVGLCLGMSCC